GPYSLLQGGNGAILRQPIYLDPARTQLWGLAILVIDWQQLARQSGLLDGTAQLELAVRNLTESHVSTVLGDPQLFSRADSYIRELQLPNARWEIAVRQPLGQAEGHFRQWLVMLLALAPLFGDLIRDPGAIHYAGLTYQIVVIAAFGFLLWLHLMAVYKASAVSSFAFLSPIFSVLMGWLILGETLGPRIWIALVLVAAGLVLINRR
ncbi:MAG: EamA family transporter, partial [Marinibacterium sp.]|nr:EamA family transporter [Marinibacterium sp.]